MGWQSIFSSEKIYQAEIVKAVLQDRHLNPVLIDKQGPHNLGFFEVHVAPEFVLEAIKIVNDDISFK